MKGEREVRKEARWKWTAARLGESWRQSGTQSRKDRRGKDSEWQGLVRNQEGHGK